MMLLDFKPGSLVFRHGDSVAGEYRFGDEFKPHFHPLRTPAGHCVTLASPHDHKHHKGLMYALRTKDVNFWEEGATTPEEVVGRQRHLDFLDIVSSGSIVGFTGQLRWSSCDGTVDCFDESRTLSCRFDFQARAFVWTWQTRLTSLRKQELIQSQWSFAHPDGRKVNYHGLGIRFRRDMGSLTRGNILCVDEEEFTGDFIEKMGTTPRTVEFTGRIDETIPVESVSVRFQQDQKNALYVCNDFFPFMALGPSNAKPVALDIGTVIEESYEVTVSDTLTR